MHKLITRFVYNHKDLESFEADVNKWFEKGYEPLGIEIHSKDSPDPTVKQDFVICMAMLTKVEKCTCDCQCCNSHSDYCTCECDCCKAHAGRHKEDEDDS